MGTLHKKKPKVIMEKGIIEDKNGKKYEVDFAGENNDFVVISFADEKKKQDESIKDILKINENEIQDICFINDYSILLVGCNKGLLYIYKRIINNKSNLKFEEIAHFKPHKESIIQITKLKSGHILTLSSDSSAKILKIEIEANNMLYQGEKKCDEIQLLLAENESSNNNSAIELESENLVISQGYFINFFIKIKNIDNSNDEKEYQLSKKLFTNSDNIFFVEIDSKTIVYSQVSNKILQFYNIEEYSLNKSINRIEFSDIKNCMSLINKEVLAIGGNNGSIYLVNTIQKQLFFVTHFENCNNISCIKPIDEETIIMGCQYYNKNFDVILYKRNNNNFQEIKRTQKVHSGAISDIKLITMNISQNKNPFTEKYNVISLGLDFRAKLLLNKSD